MQFASTITAGALTHADPVALRAWIARQKDGQYTVQIRRQYKHRSGNQNAYYWAVVIGMIAEDTGQDARAIHDCLRQMFLSREIGKLRLAKSTTELDTMEMERYLAACRTWASGELGIQIPKPDEPVLPDW